MGRIKILLCVFVFMRLNAFSLTADSSKTNIAITSRFSVGAVFIPACNYRQLTISDNANNYTSDIVAHRNTNESPLYSYSIGAGATYDINNKLSLECDILYSVKGYRWEIDWDGLTFGDMIDPRFGFIYDTQEVLNTTDSWVYEYYYIDVPVKIHYNLTGHKLKIQCSVGVVPTFFYSAYQVSEGEISGTGESYSSFRKDDESFTKIGLSGCAEIGAVYNFTDHFRISLSPQFQYSFTNLLTSEYPINSHLWSAGLNLSTFYHF
jgi:hypothetical protein